MAQKYEKFSVEKNVVITFEDTIKSSEVGTYLKANMEDFYIGTRFMVLCGVHHSGDAEGKLKVSLEKTDPGFVEDYSSMLKNVKKVKGSIWTERKYRGMVEPIFSEPLTPDPNGPYKVNRG